MLPALQQVCKQSPGATCSGCASRVSAQGLVKAELLKSIQEERERSVLKKVGNRPGAGTSQALLFIRIRLYSRVHLASAQGWLLSGPIV